MEFDLRDDTLDALWQRLPHSPADPRVLADAAEKRAHLRAWMQRSGYDGVLITRRDNFAWLTGGGDSRVITSTEAGFGSLLVTPDHHYLLAHSMDSFRLHEEQAPGQGYELVTLRWHQGDPRQRAFDFGVRRLASDTPLDGAVEVNQDISRLHFPLTNLEIDRLRWLSRQTGLILEDVAGWVRPGMSEEAVARRMHARFIHAGIDLDVLIVGSDERISRYRHPLPTARVIERYVLLHPAARRWGLHANVTRAVHFGPPPGSVRRAFDTAAAIEARLLAVLKPGLLFRDILAQQMQWYAELGYPGEWEHHFQGGPTAYMVADPARCLGDSAVEINQAFDWFITVTGAKVEELVLLTSTGVEIASQAGGWPELRVDTAGGSIAVPDLMIC